MSFKLFEKDGVLYHQGDKVIVQGHGLVPVQVVLTGLCSYEGRVYAKPLDMQCNSIMVPIEDIYPFYTPTVWQRLRRWWFVLNFRPVG